MVGENPSVSAAVAAHPQTSSQVDPPYLSVVLPIYQEREVIEHVVMEIIEVLRRESYAFEVIAVDDGSTDGTGEILTDLEARCSPHLRVLRHPYNKGNGAAVKTGIRVARGEALILMDADGQHDPVDIPRLLAYLGEYDLAVGARTADSASPWHRKLANSVYNRLASYLSKFEIRDLTSGFRAFKTALIRDFVHLLPNGFSYPTTSTLAFIKAGYSVKYVPIKAAPRTGQSKIKLLQDGMRFLVIIVKVIVLFEPLRVFLPTAVFLIALALLSFLYTLLFEGRLHIPNSSVILGVSAVLVFLIGLVSEQIAELRISIRPTEQ